MCAFVPKCINGCNSLRQLEDGCSFLEEGIATDELWGALPGAHPPILCLLGQRAFRRQIIKILLCFELFCFCNKMRKRLYHRVLLLRNKRFNALEIHGRDTYVMPS